MKIERNVSLLDVLAVEMRCTYLSDLRLLSNVQKLELARLVEKIPPEEASLDEWNDALEYLIGISAQTSREMARSRLIWSLDLSWS